MSVEFELFYLYEVPGCARACSLHQLTSTEVIYPAEIALKHVFGLHCAPVSCCPVGQGMRGCKRSLQPLMKYLYARTSCQLRYSPSLAAFAPIPCCCRSLSDIMGEVLSGKPTPEQSTYSYSFVRHHLLSGYKRRPPPNAGLDNLQAR